MYYRAVEKVVTERLSLGGRYGSGVDRGGGYGSRTGMSPLQKSLYRETGDRGRFESRVMIER